MFVINRHAVKMQFVYRKIKIQFVNVHQAIEVIRFQKLVVNWLMHVHNVTNHRCVSLHQPVIFVSVHQVILVFQNRLDASHQLVNVKAMHNVRIRHDA